MLNLFEAFAAWFLNLSTIYGFVLYDYYQIPSGLPLKRVDAVMDKTENNLLGKCYFMTEAIIFTLWLMLIDLINQNRIKETSFCA